MSYDERFAEFEKLGVQEVRARLAKNQYKKYEHPVIHEWLKLKEAESKDRANAREEESLEISRKALEVSERSRKLSIIAIVVSAATAIAVAVIQIVFPSK